jgi:hypothetical protein
MLLMGAPILSDSIGSIRRATQKKNDSDILTLLTGGKIEENHEAALTSMVRIDNIKTKKRKGDDDDGNNASPRSSTTGGTKISKLE